MLNLLLSGTLLAQNDLDPPLPNVMLLVDSSGSMEYKLDGSGFPACFPGGGQTSEKSRWVDLVEILTGTINDYRCQSVNRSSSEFLSDYDTNGAAPGRPSDYQYANPYHRPMSGECVALPNPAAMTSNAYEFPDGAIRFREYDAVSGTCQFTQAQDGILDSYKEQIRFGLMTFDTLTSAKTGVSGQTLNYAEGMEGGWSYVWGTAATANPAGCIDPPIEFDVGARNAAAPPWEGRMVAFGNPATGSDEYKTKRAQIEQILLATRPFGATPIAGLLHDARDFFVNDTSRDPLDPSGVRSFGPRDDPYVIDTTIQPQPDPDPDAPPVPPRVIRGCREQSIVLLTDGQPNLDMRPFCLGDTLGKCPFQKPEDIVLELVSRDRPIDTFVIPFALPTFELNGVTLTCNDLSDDDFNETSPPNSPPTLCGDPANAGNLALQACCSLNRIAVAGSRPDKLQYYPGHKPRAFFSQNREQLASALSSVLAGTLNVTSRTQPVIAGAAAGSTGMRFFSLVQPRPLRPWVGFLRRQRWMCNADFEPVPAAVAIDKGDDFGANMAAHRDQRRFATVEAGNGSEPIHSSRSIRPYYSSSTQEDGAGVYTGSRRTSAPAGFSSIVAPAAMNIDATSCEGLTASDCRNRYLKWLIGEDNGTEFSRCPSASDCNVLGDILHSTPRVVGPPSELLRDETYALFASQQRTRPIVLYTSSNDGFLHAFKVGINDLTATDAEKALTFANNELWAFIPPAVLPQLKTQYPFNHKPLLDGTPVVKDVVATRSSEEEENATIVAFERLRADAIQGQAGYGTWRTVLLQSFGPMQGGYFALDVTEPELNASDLADATAGPRFLWQLTTYANDQPLFGDSGPTPAITTLYFDPTGGSSPREIAVAVLPGGGSNPGSSSGDGCPNPQGRNYSDLFFSHDVVPRSRVRCYSETAANQAARSLTVVRLDNGEIIRTFRQAASEITNTDLQARVTAVDIDSPITGQPVAFPAETGAVADRVYVGDRDGRLWRVDLSSTNPANWSMQLFFDAFPQSIAGVNKHGFADGQPILLPPAVSVDINGDVTINLATGDQETLGAAPGMTNYVWSLTEKLDIADRSKFTRHVNWYLPLLDGERVVGPLSLFNSQVFFTTYTPAPSNAPACRNGESRIWGMDYLRPPGFGVNPDPPIDEGGDPRLPDPEAPENPERFLQVLSAEEATGRDNAVVFGVSVAQQPTCSDVQTEDVPSNDFLGYGAHHQVRSVNPGRFELVMHTGGTAPASPSGDISSNVATIPLRAPPSASRVESWAALIE